MAILLPCPKCGKRVNLQNEYAGKKWKCTGCKTKIRVPDPEKDSPGSVKCSCGNQIETWNVFAKEGVFCPACKKVYTPGSAEKLPSMISLEEKKETKQAPAPPAAPVLLEIPELEVDDDDLLIDVDEEEVVDGAELLIEEDIEIVEEIELVSDEEEIPASGDRRLGARRKGDRRKGDRRKGGRRKKE